MKKTFKVLSIVVLFLGVSFASIADNGSDEKTNKEAVSTFCNISGKIVDTVTGEALVGVKVEIPGTKLCTYSDFDGNFSFEKLNPGTYSISTNLISYTATTCKGVDISLGKDQTVKISLKPVSE
ncbi:MAG: carboxypeptidase-like regulatory domain-containing protein [Bacteroidales bacterium]|nr:carboxypeptidase-like regulatory domain-containing protein [Bacteroidales bacterium]MCF8457639.1 carboxypeptidase-like regulatory domain-containing protein [Bacteroidales bacterium]